jgi:putative oxidoreductase
MRAALWSVQLLLALFALLAGVNHALRPLDDAARTAPWTASIPPILVRLIGWSELAAAIGLVLPAATRILPGLTPLAAAGLATIMALAIPFHVMRGEANVIGMQIVVIVLCFFVAWGRLGRAPILPRS